jgi:hypothetical protein
MQVGKAGILLGWFDRVSCIRTVVETTPGEDWVRYIDAHYFKSDTTVRTNPKTILHAPDVLDETDAMNLWTRVHDREAEKARQQLGIHEDEPPRVTMGLNVWRRIGFDTTYEETVALAAEFGTDQVFIDSVFQNGETLRVQMEDLVPEEKRKGTVPEKRLPSRLSAPLSLVAVREAWLAPHHRKVYGLIHGQAERHSGLCEAGGG